MSMKNNTLAPIILFVYNRPWHTKQTLDALAKNELAKESVLYIYADGAKANATEEDLQKIKEVREVISTFKGCKEIHIIVREKNWGLADNVIDGVTKIVNQYEKIIVLEDDIVVSSYFLEFMNKGLDLYENNDKVYGISGYLFFPNSQLPSTFFLPIGSSWGWATWKRAWDAFESNAEKLLQKIQDESLEKQFNFGSYPYLEMLQNQVNGIVNSWAIRFQASIFIRKGYFLYPNQSIVKNIGMDNSGTHCKEDVYENELYERVVNMDVQSIDKSKESIKWVRNKFENQFSKQKDTFWLRLQTQIKKIV